jgi:hypothetical protein
MVYPGAGIAVSTGSAWTTSLTAPTGAIVGAGQANTWSTGAQDFGSATSLKVPTSAGAAPTTSGFVGYDSTANKFKAGVNGAAHTFVTADASGNAAIPGTVTTGDGTVAGEIVLAELDASAGAEYISLVGPDDRSTSLRLLLPTADPAAGNVLAFTAPSSNISTGSWINPATAASGGSLTTSGAYAATLTVTGATNVTLPTSGTLATTADPVFTGSTQIPNGTGPTVDAAGEIAVDTTTDQLQFYGGAKRALPSIKFFSIVLPSVDETTDDLLFMKLPYGITLVSINGIVSAATSATFNIQECNSSGASCADMATSDIAADTDGTETTSFSDGTAASGAWLKIDVASKSGTPGTLTVTVAYRVVVD